MNDLSKPMHISKNVLGKLTEIRKNANRDGITTFGHADLVALEQSVVDDTGEPWLSRLNSKNHDSNNEKIIRFIMFMNGDDNTFTI